MLSKVTDAVRIDVVAAHHAGAPRDLLELRDCHD